ncbi:MAG: hemerythrin domain-containing protein [Trebonia sp.]
MLAAHHALRRDLVSLARAAQFAGLPDPARRRSVAAGWGTFKRQLHAHHKAEDELIWPLLRQRLTHSENGLSVLGEMEAEHALVDPLLDAVDAAFSEKSPSGGPGPGRGRGDAVDALTVALTSHLTHEERDALPLIGVTLTAREWRGAGLRIARRNGLSGTAEMFPWMVEGAPQEEVRATLGQLPPPARMIYRRVWKPRYKRTSRW